MKNKKAYLEAIRLLSLFFVLYTHTGNYGMHHYPETSNPLNFWFSQSLVLLSQTCVPLFFMISGAVLLHKESTFKEIWTVAQAFLALTCLTFRFETFLNRFIFFYTQGFFLSALFIWLFLCMITGIIFINVLKLIPGIKNFFNSDWRIL